MWRLDFPEDSSGKPSANAGVKNSQMIKIINMNNLVKEKLDYTNHSTVKISKNNYKTHYSDHHSVFHEKKNTNESIIHCFKMYKISLKVKYFIEKTMQTWRGKLTAGGRSLAETKILRGIFQGDALSPMLFIRATMPLNHILRKCTAGYKLGRSQEKIKHLMYMDDIKRFAKKLKITGNSHTQS